MSNPLGPSHAPRLTVTQPGVGAGGPGIAPPPRGSTVSAMNPAPSSGRPPAAAAAGATQQQPPTGSTLQPQQRSAAAATTGAAARNTPSPIPPLANGGVGAASLGSGPVPSSASAAYQATGGGSAPNSARGGADSSSRSLSRNGGGGGNNSTLPHSRSNTNLSSLSGGPVTVAAPPLAASTSFAPRSSSSAAGSMPQPIRQRGQSEIVPSRSAPQQQQQQQQRGSSSATSTAASTAAPGSDSPFLRSRSNSGSFSASCPNWGPVLFPPLHAPVAPASGSETARGLSTLYQRAPSPVTAAMVPFAPPPIPAQNICDDPTFYELYKTVWACGFHGIHDGIERPAVLSLLPARVFWAGKRVLDIGCGAGHLCRQMRKAHARLVVGVDCSTKMLTVARAREAQEETAYAQAAGQTGLFAGLTGSGGGGGSSGAIAPQKGVGSMLKKLFSSGSGSGSGSKDEGELNEAQMSEKLEMEKRRILARRAQEKLKAEDEARDNRDLAKSIAAATLAAEREAERQDRESDGTTDNSSSSSKHSASGSSSSSGFLSKLFNKKDARALKPSSEAETYIREAEAKRVQREHEERILRAAAVAEQARLGVPVPHEFLDDLSSASSTATGSPPFMACKFVHSTFEEWAPSAEIITAAAAPGAAVSAAAAAAAAAASQSEDGGALFDLITCCMTIQFIWDLKAFARKVYTLLAPNGLFVLSVDHPVATACWGVHPVVIKSERNPLEIQYFPLDGYGEQGVRTAKYYVEGVVKYHRRIDSYLNVFLQAGLCLERILEPRASNEMELAHPELKTWRRKPIFLCLRFRKPRHEDF